MYLGPWNLPLGGRFCPRGGKGLGEWDRRGHCRVAELDLCPGAFAWWRMRRGWVGSGLDGVLAGVLPCGGLRWAR